MVTERKFLTQGEIAKYFGRNALTVIEWEKRGMPVYRPIGGHPMYDLEEILAWMRANSIREEGKKEG